MPVCTRGRMALWCELDDFEILDLRAGEERSLSIATPREHYICVSGALELRHQAVQVTLEALQQYEVRSGGQVQLKARTVAHVFRAVGHWAEIQGAGIFSVKVGVPPADDSPYSYAKHTTFDRHYHDCDEYWIFLEGRVTAVCGEEFYELGPGDCLATPQGWNHDIPQCHSTPVSAIWFESTLQGRRRTGHLWEPRDGKAVPKAV